MTAPRLGIGVIGAGRVGAVLAAALRSEGHAITGTYAVSDASVARAEQLLPGVPLLEVADIIERSEMLLLAVPDDQLGPLVAGRSEERRVGNEWRSRRGRDGGRTERTRSGA